MTLTVVNNLGSAAQDYNVTMANVGFSPGLNVVDVLSCREVVVGGNGTLVAQFEGGLPMVSLHVLFCFYPLLNCPLVFGPASAATASPIAVRNQRVRLTGYA